MDIAMTHGVRTNATHFGTSLKKFFILLAALMLAALALTFAAPASSASAAEAIAQCNSIDNTGGLGISCDVTVINNLDVTTGVASSTVTLKECGGPANTEPTCTTTPMSFNSLVTSVNQCNNAANGGGASVICNVFVTNNSTGGSTADITEATVDQCNGSGAEGNQPTLDCSPFPASTSGATITQCNGSTNGGGAQDRVTCRVTPSTMSAQLPVSINQCNGTANGGGSVLTCTASLTNTVLAATPPTTPPAKNVLNDARTDGFTHPGWNNGSSDFLGVGVLLVAGLLTAAFVTRRMRAHR